MTVCFGWRRAGCFLYASEIVQTRATIGDRDLVPEVVGIIVQNMEKLLVLIR